jgi:hypothetical protein
VQINAYDPILYVPRPIVQNNQLGTRLGLILLGNDVYFDRGPGRS